MWVRVNKGDKGPQHSSISGPRPPSQRSPARGLVRGCVTPVPAVALTPGLRDTTPGRVGPGGGSPQA